jgi:NitT/TauT family transport system ATP-binding protein
MNSSTDNNDNIQKAIVIRGVTKDFIDQNTGKPWRALEDINLDVRQGKLICIIGASGCGKTTLLNLIAGFDHPSQGRIEVGGVPVAEPGPDRMMVFQDYALLPWLSTIGNIEFVLRAQRIPAAQRRLRAMEVLELVGLAEFANRPIYRLSGGMRQRVALARALVLRPKVLLMDEPFAALDAQQRTLMQSELMRLWKETNQTIVFVTHSLEEAIYLGDEIILLRSRPGRIGVTEVVKLPRPRDVTGTEFNEVKRQLGTILNAEIERSEVVEREMVS